MPPPAKPPVPSLTIPLHRARLAWSQGHGLSAPSTATPAALAATTGWPRTLGGIDAYLSFAARDPDLAPAAVDAAVCVERTLSVTPAARSCIYLVPAATVPKALRHAASLTRKRNIADCAKAGLPEAELQRIVHAAAAVVTDQPMTTDALRAAMPPGVVRPLGEAGKKVGMSTAFPVALRILEAEGWVERTPGDGHLRNERYVWRRPAVNPVQAAGLGGADEDPLALLAALATHYFGCAAPATQKEFADWAGATQKDAAAAMATLDLAAVAITDREGLHWIPRSKLAQLQNDAPPCLSPRLLGFSDPLVDYRSNMAGMVDPRWHAVEVPGLYGKPTPLGQLKALWQRAIVDAGEVVGIWEYDVDANEAVTALFGPLAPARQALLEAEADRIGRFISTLGDARSFSLDSPAELRKRAGGIRDLAARWIPV